MNHMLILAAVAGANQNQPSEIFSLFWVQSDIRWIFEVVQNQGAQGGLQLAPGAAAAGGGAGVAAVQPVNQNGLNNANMNHICDFFCGSYYSLLSKASLTVVF
jgi:hypothetical protein